MVRTEWTTDGELLVRDLDLKETAEFFASDDEMSRSMAGREGRSGLMFRLNHQRKHAWHTPDGDAPDAQWHETDYAAVLGWAWDRGAPARAAGRGRI